MKRTAGEIALIDFTRNYILNNWESFSDAQIIKLCNAIITNDADDYTDIITTKERFMRRYHERTNGKPGDKTETMSFYEFYDRNKELIYADYYGDLSPDLPENDSIRFPDKCHVRPISMRPQEVRSKVGPLALEILKTDFFDMWNEPWEYLLPALGLPTDMICAAFSVD